MPLLLWRAFAYVVSASMLEISQSRPGTILGGLFAIQALWSVTAVVLKWRSVMPFAIADTIALTVLAAAIGLTPTSVHMLLAVDVMAVFAVVDRRAGLVALWVAGAAVVAGFALHRLPPPIVLPAETIQRVEIAAALVGAVLSVAVIRVLIKAVQAGTAAQDEVIATQRRNAELQQNFLAMVSHELRTPLTSIRGFAEILELDLNSLDPQEAAEFVTAISEQSQHLSRLVDDVLVVLRLESGTIPIEVDRVEVERLFGTVAMLVNAPGHKKIRYETGGVEAVRGDADRLAQVLRNLVENAVKYGGDNIAVTASVDDSMVELSVADDGDGIPADKVKAVFGEFVQLGRPAERVSSGFGLGLSICRRLVDAMGGEIDAEPLEPGVRFTIKVPVHMPAVAAEAGVG